MRVAWSDLGTAAADAADGQSVEIGGFPVALLPGEAARYFILQREAGCCAGCVPRAPLAAIEVFADAPIRLDGRALRLTGIWQVLRRDPAGWRYQLRAARSLAPAGWGAVGRRTLLVAGPLMCLAATAPPRETAAPAPDAPSAGRDAIAGAITVDMHSHAGGINHLRRLEGNKPWLPVGAPMRAGGMAAICLAVVADKPVHKVEADGRIHPFRDPAPGELYNFTQLSLRRALDLARSQNLAVIADAAGLRAARNGTPSVVIASEGADFLEGRIDRVDEAFHSYTLRHLQLTHYRVNELGDIQTEAPVHNGLTDFGAEVIRRCNRLGIVVDVAHGTLALVKRAASVTQKPLILSHTALTSHPKPMTRLITRDHARVIADTGGVIGVWPPATEFPTLTALAAGMARMVDAVGLDHVGLGSDQNGLTSPSVFADYDQLPQLADALLGVGFKPNEVGKLLGGNYARVFEASMA